MQISELPIYNAPNYAPLKPLLDLRESEHLVNTSVVEQCRNLLNEYNARDEAVIHAIAETAYTIASFIAGKQIFQKSYRGNGGYELVANPSIDPNKIKSCNITQFQTSQMQEDLISSNPDFEPADMFRSYEYEKQIKASKAVWNNYEPKFYNAWFNQQQALALITGGTAIEQVKYDASKKAFKMFREIWGSIEMPISAGFGKCYICKFSGRYEDLHSWDNRADEKEFGEKQAAGSVEASDALKTFPQCPECGSFEVDGEQAESAQVPSIIGREQYDIGDFVLNNVPIQSVRFDVSRRFEESPYSIIHQYVPTSKIKHLLGDLELNAGTESDRGLDLLAKMARIGASIGGARHELGDTQTAKQSLLSAFSADADILSQIEIGRLYEDRETVSGGSLEKGQTLADLCPDGGTLLFLNKHILYGIYPKHHKNECSSAVYFAKPFSGTGRGAEDLIEIQKRKTRLDAQQVAAVDGASPGRGFVEGAIDEKNVARLGFPNSNTPIRREFFNQTKDVRALVHQFEPMQVAPQLFAYSQEIDKLAQMTAHQVTLGNAVFDASGDTATEANILAATAQAITIPFLQSKAGMRLRTCRNLRRGYNEIFGEMSRKFSLGGGRQFSAIEVSGADVSDEIEFVIVANSFIPQNFYSRKVDYAAFTNTLGGIEGVKMIRDGDPHLFQTYAKAFNVDFGDDNYDQIQEICRLRMMQAFEMAEMFQAAMQSAPAASQMLPTSPPQQALPPEQLPNAGNSLTPNAENSNLPVGQNAPQSPQSPPVEQSAMPNATPNAMPTAAPNAMPTAAPPEQILYDELFDNLHPRILPKEKNHLQKADWFAEFLETADALQMDEIKRGIICEFIIRHEEADLADKTAKMAKEQQAQFQAGLPTMAMQAKLAQMSGEAEQAK